MSAGRWKGETVICVASGPSLTEADCALAKASGHKIITVNSSWRAVPNCDAIYASDHNWWKRSIGELAASTAERWTNNRQAHVDFGLQLYPNAVGCNSGLAAIHMAHWFGAARILLIGYDCQATNGQLHWHGNHPKGMMNPNHISFRIWARQYRKTGSVLREKTINCSRQTAIKVFERMPLEQALELCRMPEPCATERTG